jgi:ATP synthase protein I
MDEQRKKKSESSRTSFSRQVGVRERRKLKARRGTSRSIWFGLGMLGLVGWSVAVPTLLGVALGVWIDNHYPSRYSWTLMLLVIGLLIGCLTAWHWMAKEHREIRKEQEEDDTNHHEHP